jgi:Flp pilus assembly pilin Flp
MGYLARLWTRRSRHGGQGIAEYGLILAGIAVVAIVALFFLGGNISGLLSTIGHTV